MKYIWIYLCLGGIFLCWGCQKKKQNDLVLSVSVLRGPSAIAFAGWISDPPQLNGRRLSIEIVDSPDKIQAALIKGETDIAVLPMISAANLYNKGIAYRLAGCPIWGTLYLVTCGAPQSIHLFAAGTTPDILARHYLCQNELSYPLVYTFSTPAEIFQGIRAGKVKTAVLSEPFLSKALQSDSTLTIWADLNQGGDSVPGFAQTAVLYHPSLQKEKRALDSLLQSTCQYAVGQPEEAIRTLETHGVFPVGMLTPESIERCKIHYLPALQAEKSIYAFLELIQRYEPEAIGKKLPEKDFIAR